MTDIQGIIYTINALGLSLSVYEQRNAQQAEEIERLKEQISHMKQAAEEQAAVEKSS